MAVSKSELAVNGKRKIPPIIVKKNSTGRANRVPVKTKSETMPTHNCEY